MKKYEVTLVEQLTYRIEVEAENDVEAEALALSSDKFTQSIVDDNDTITATTFSVKKQFEISNLAAKTLS
jgi:hypothetical protein